MILRYLVARESRELAVYPLFLAINIKHSQCNKMTKRFYQLILKKIYILAIKKIKFIFSDTLFILIHLNYIYDSFNIF